MSQEVSSGQGVVLGYKKSSERKRKSMLLELNSIDRSVVSYPNPAQYRVRLYRPLKDIHSIQIVGGTVPTRLYNVSTNWNQFTFQEDGNTYDLTIPPGKYTYTALATTINSLLNVKTGGVNTYSVSFSAISGCMTINRSTGTTSFALLFGSGNFVDQTDRNNTLTQINSPAHILGFQKADYSDNGTGIITSPNCADIDFMINRVYLYLNHDNTQDLATIEREVGRRQPHAIIYMDEPNLPYKYLNKELFEPLYCSSPAPIARMATLDVSLLDQFDNLVDLCGRDWTLLLEIIYYDQSP
jgi:hypothetical protein